MSGIDFLKQNQQYQMDCLLKKDGWNIWNGRADQIVYVKNGVFATGWTEIDNNWYYFDQQTHFRLQSVPLVEKGKEYFLGIYGNMLTDVNHKGSYYGEDGSKQGPAMDGKTDVSKVSIDGVIGYIDESEAEQLIKEEKIKANFSCIVFGTSVSEPSVHYYLDPKYKGTVGMTEEEFQQLIEKHRQEEEKKRQKTLNSMSESDFN
jgi:hypothetical protein